MITRDESRIIYRKDVVFYKINKINSIGNTPSRARRTPFRKLYGQVHKFTREYSPFIRETFT